MTTIARIGSFECVGGELETLASFFENKIVPEFLKLEGFLGYEAFVDRKAGRYVGVSRWATLDALATSKPSAAEVGEAVKAIGARMIGTPAVMEEVFETRRDRR